jgi:hypothetical protein
MPMLQYFVSGQLKEKKKGELRGILVSDKGDIIYDRGEKRYENPSNNKIGSSTVY